MFEVQGALLAVALLSFAAMDAHAASRPVRIALVSDTHVMTKTSEDQAIFRAHFEKVIRDVNAASVDAVLVAGDLTQGGLEGEFADFLSQAKGFKAPVLTVPGNHDVGDKPLPGKEGAVNARRVALYEKEMGPSFYVRKIGDVRLIALNAYLFGSGLPGEAEQWALLERELAAPAKEPTLILLHTPLFLEKPDEGGGGYWNVEPEPRKRLLDLVHKGHVNAVLSGHLHRSISSRREGTLFATTPPVSFGLPRYKQAEGWTLVVVRPDGRVTTEFHPVATYPQPAAPAAPAAK